MRATPETGKRIRQRAKSIFDAAQLRRIVDRNPFALLHLAKELNGSKRRRDNHLRALPFADVPAFVVKLDEYGQMLRDTGQSVAAYLALKFALLCASRTSEVLKAKWSEFNGDLRLWTIPPSRMKAETEHVVYLSDPAREVLREARKATESSYVFPSPLDPERALSDMSLLMALRRLRTGAKNADGKAQTFGDATTTHGLCRACFSSWAYQTNAARPDAIEATLAHAERDRVKAAYSHQADLATERRALLAKWAAFVVAPPAPRGKVVDIGGARRKRA